MAEHSERGENDIFLAKQKQRGCLLRSDGHVCDDKKAKHYKQKGFLQRMDTVILQIFSALKFR